MIVGLHWLHSAWVSFLLYHGLVLWVVGRERPVVQALVQGWDRNLGVGAVLFGLGGGMLLYLLAPRMGIDAELLTPILDRLGLHGGGWLAFVAYHTLVNPWFEEALWRGYLGRDTTGLVWGDFLFAGYHALVLVLFVAWYWILTAVVLLVGAGWFWRQLRQRLGGMLVPVISHLAADGSIMAVVYLLSR